MFTKMPRSRITATKLSDRNKLKSRFAGIFFIVIITLIGACSSSSSGVSKTDREAFINTYVDLTLIQIQFGKRLKNSQAAEDNVFARYGTSKEFMDDFVVKIAGKPELQEEIYREIADRLNKLRSMPSDSLDRYLKSLNYDI
jgi:hypothetical protein